MTRAARRATTAAAVAVSWLGAVGIATATMPIQKKAKEGGFPATSCTYCHVDKLPKKGASALTDRGKYLVGQKEKRKTTEVDVAWLKDYVVPK